jgi:hypothetical protein
VPEPGADGKERDVAPWDGMQSFGTLDVSRDAITTTIWDLDGKERFKVDIAYRG